MWMSELYQKRENFTKRIRRAARQKQIHQNREILIQYVTNLNTFPIFVRDFMMNIKNKKYPECSRDIQYLLSNPLELQNKQILEKECSRQIIDGLTTLVVKSEVTSKTKNQIIKILVILSKEKELHQEIVPYCEKILQGGEEVNLCCVIFGNVMGSEVKKVRMKMWEFIVNQDLQTQIMTEIHSEKKYPLHNWLHFCQPYANIRLEQGYAVNTFFFKQIQKLCISHYISSDLTSKIEEVILEYLDQSSLSQLPQSSETIQFISKLCNSKFPKYSLPLLIRYTQHSSWLTDNYFNIDSILLLIIHSSSISVKSLSLKLLTYLLMKSQTNHLARYFIRYIWIYDEFRYIIQRDKELETETVLFIQEIFEAQDRLEGRLQLVRLYEVGSIDGDVNAEIVYNMVKRVMRGEGRSNYEEAIRMMSERD